jgi:hypothetical protein
VRLFWYQDARNDAEKAVATDPAYWKGWSRLGTIQMVLGQHVEAKISFEKALLVQGGGPGADVTRKDLTEVERLIKEKRDKLTDSHSGSQPNVSAFPPIPDTVPLDADPNPLWRDNPRPMPFR